MKPSTPAAYQLFHEGQIALANVEANGMRIDLEYLDNASRRAHKKIKRIEEGLKADPIYKTWRKVYGVKTNLYSGEQLAHILFTVLGYPCREWTKATKTHPKGRPSTAETNLVDIDIPFVTDYRRVAKYKKADSTFLSGIRAFVEEDGFLHGSWHLNIPASFRSSSSDPNFQNFPIRNEETAKLVRSAFIARDGHRLVESDFKGVEVGTACCYNKDPKLIHDYTMGDMHRDMAMECYKLPLEEVTSKIRYCGKNMYVFPEFYGSYWMDCSRNLWEACGRMKLETTSGVTLLDHLRSVGIKKLGDAGKNEEPRKGTFQHHIKAVENRFWNERYHVYNEWKKQTWTAYQHRGYCELYTGFVCTKDSDGLPMNRKQVINYQIQGAAFHCLLWVLIQMEKWLRKKKMRSVIVSQIHDSIIADVHDDELDEYLAKINEVMTVDLPRYWSWIIVPFSAEMEVCPLGGNWYQKEKRAA